MVVQRDSFPGRSLPHPSFHGEKKTHPIVLQLGYILPTPQQTTQSFPQGSEARVAIRTIRAILKRTKAQAMTQKIPVRNPNEISKLRKAGEVSARILMELMPIIKPGITTREIDDYARELFKREGCGNAFYGYYGYPGQLCISVNEEVVHGIGGTRVIRDGDIVSLDAGAIVDGWYGDNAMTVAVGNVSEEAKRLLAVTEEALFRAIEQAKQGNPLSDVCGAVEDYVRPYGFGIVREYVGHGVGRKLHEEPQIPNYRPNYPLPRLKRGMILAIEPMITLGSCRVKVLDDDWTAVTADGSWAAHFEHTVAVGSHRGEILTERPRIALPEQLGITL